MTENFNKNDLEEIQRFQEYLRIPTMQINGQEVDYTDCVEFLKQQAGKLDLPCIVYTPFLPTKPIVVMSWTGSDPNAKSIMLNSHMDVVPVFEEYWTHPPFAAEIDDSGRIFARGTQDMKSVGMQFLAAIRALKRKGVEQFKRTIHVTFVPDEERGGETGMGKFVNTKEFIDLNVGFCLDEGMASPNETFSVFYAEKSVWSIMINCHGPTGHSSLFHENTAIEKVHFLLNKIHSWRNELSKKLKENRDLSAGDVSTVNVTSLNGGVATNVVPAIYEMIVDIRLSPDIDQTQVENNLRKWCREAGDDVEFKFIYKESFIAPTKTNEDNPFWKPFKEALDELKLNFEVKVFPGATDSRYLRKLSIPVLGFSPMNCTPILLHEHDEFLDANIYIEGIQIYSKIIEKLAMS